MPTIEIRPAQRLAFCRVCEQDIQKGDEMVTWYTNLSRGQNIHIHPKCVLHLAGLVMDKVMETKNAP